jgi:hypothetical protein
MTVPARAVVAAALLLSADSACSFSGSGGFPSPAAGPGADAPMLRETQQGDGEPAQRALTADAHTTALYLFKEGEGATTAAEVGPSASLRGAEWAIGRNYFAAATGSGYVGVPDSPATRPAAGLTVEVWAKFDKVGGDLICKNGAYMLRLGSSMEALVSVGGGWKTLTGSLNIPAKTWTHLALTYDPATGEAKTFVNGALDAVLSVPGGGPINGTSDLRIGQNDWAPESSIADAKVDAFRVSNTTRNFRPMYPPAKLPSVSGNLVPNGGFDLGLAAGWRGQGYGDHNLCWTTLESGGVSGGAMLQSTPGTSELPVHLLSRPIAVAVGRTYSWSVWVKGRDASDRATFALVGTGTSEKFDGSVLASCSAAPGSTWVKISGEFTVPSNFSCPSAAFLVNDPGSTSQLSYDEFRVEDTTATGAAPLSEKVGVGSSYIPLLMPVGHVYLQGSGGILPLKLFNRDAAEAHTVTFEPITTDWQQLTIAAGQPSTTVTLQPNGSAPVPLTINTSSIGYFELRFNLSSSGVNWQDSAFIRYAVVADMTNVGQASTSHFAMNTHMEREPSAHLKRNLQILAKCGVKYIRAWWGWGMCEQVKGTFEFSEYERQFDAVTDGTGMGIMPILLRYYQCTYLPWETWCEAAWAGNTSCAKGNCIQLPPFPDQVDEFGVFAGKVAAHFKGRVNAYEIWNEPTYTMGDKVYASLLKAAYPQIKANDPGATVVGMAGIPLTSDDPETTCSITGVLARHPPFDVLSEHAYAQLPSPDTAFPARMTAVKRALADAGRSDAAIWHTEQGLTGNDDGFGLAGDSESDIAQLYIRDAITAWSQGSSKFFWFSQDVSTDYDYSVFYGGYVPRPRLVALNAMASLLEGLSYHRSFLHLSSVFMHLFRGPDFCVAAVWTNGTAAVDVRVPLDPSSITAFDTMANPFQLGSATSSVAVASVVPVPAARPIFLKAPDADAMAGALASATAETTFPGVVVAKRAGQSVVVKLTGMSPTPLDGIVDFGADSGSSKHFVGLARGQTTELTLSDPVQQQSTVRVRVGDQSILSSTFPVGTTTVAAHGHEATAPSSPCVSDMDCSLNGECRDGSCSCYAGWKGSSCGWLDFKPLRNASASGFNEPNINTWGGSIVKDFLNEKWHMYLSYMELGCTLQQFKPNSKIVHAVSEESAIGPYVFSDSVTAPWSHNPHVQLIPATDPPLYVIYHIGNGNSTYACNCTDGVQPACNALGKCPPSDCATTATMLASTSPYGPWQEYHGPYIVSANPVKPLGFRYTNPALHFFQNGSAILAYRRSLSSWGINSTASGEGIGLAFCSNWSGPCHDLTPHAPALNGHANCKPPDDKDSGGNCEDAALWQDGNKNWHMFTHQMHHYARSLASWASSPLAEPGDAQPFDDGCDCLSPLGGERPQIVLHDSKVQFLSNGCRAADGSGRSRTWVREVDIG